jgi:hypothetical protein
MAMFKHVGALCECVDDEVNRRLFSLDPETPGRVYAYLGAKEAVAASDQFSRYGVLGEGRTTPGSW